VEKGSEDIGVDSRRERDSFLHIRRGADCEARLQFGVGTDRLSCGQQPGREPSGALGARAPQTLGPTGPRRSGCRAPRRVPHRSLHITTSPHRGGEER